MGAGEGASGMVTESSAGEPGVLLLAPVLRFFFWDFDGATGGGAPGMTRGAGATSAMVKTKG